VYDVAGRIVRTLADGTLASGRHEQTWDGRDEAGKTVAAGVYFVRLDADDVHERRSMVLLR
jgi:flagellar hook assembly protein FlgD